MATKYALKYDNERKYVLKGSDIYTTTSLIKARKTAREIIAHSSSINSISVMRLEGDWCEGIVTFDRAIVHGIGWVYIPYSGTEALWLKADGTVRDFTQPLKVKRATYLVEKTWGN
mgnify:CR=1 FL=1